jgi:hypothetical protein
MTSPLNRRAALGALAASIPALAILPAAASPPPTTALANLIEEHRAAWAAFGRLVDALEAAEPDKSILVPCLAREPIAVGSSREGLINVIEDNFESEVRKLNRLLELSPELGAAACDRLAQERDACRARLEEVFADYRVVEDAYDNAGDAEDDALMAICAHRCASLEEAAIRARYLTSNTIDLQTRHIDALFASFLPEGRTIPGPSESAATI